MWILVVVRFHRRKDCCPNLLLLLSFSGDGTVQLRIKFSLIMVIPENGIRIELPFIELSDRKNCVLKEGYMILYEDYAFYKNVSDYNSNDNEEAIWKDYKSNYRWTRLRADITEVNMVFDNSENTWSVQFSFGRECNAWHFHSPKDALALHNILQEYFISRLKKSSKAQNAQECDATKLIEEAVLETKTTLL